MKKFLTVALATAGLAAPCWAELSATVVIEPTARKDGLLMNRSCLEAALSKQVGKAVSVLQSDDLTDAMRATRSGTSDLFLAPAQVAASALAHGYELLGANEAQEQYLLVGNNNLKGVADLRRARLYLPQQDSLYTYLARGMLTASGLSFKDLAKVEYARYPQAGLMALTLKAADATVVKREDWEAWLKEHPGQAKQLATSGAVPGGISVVVKKDMAAEAKIRLAKWLGSNARDCGLKPLGEPVDLAAYKKVSELGTFTPTAWPGLVIVAAEEVKRLQAQGAAVIDTRTEREYRLKHIPGALFVPYHEKSLKDVVYDVTLDEFSGLRNLNPKVPTIFHCNGAECWKSYKASRAAVAAGFSRVYWYRGGMPDWEKTGQSVITE